MYLLENFYSRYMYPTEIDAALAEPTSGVARALMSLHESQWFDRKSSRVAPKDLAITMIAMANAEGGAIAVGLHDGTVEDVDAIPDRVNALLQASIDHTRPPVRARARRLAAINEAGDAVTLLVFEIEPGDLVHESAAGDCYLRVGDESRRLGFQQRQELAYDRWLRDESLEDLDNLPAPDVLAREIVEDLSAALAEFEAVAAALEHQLGVPK